jgi:hypothetical protein
MNLLLFLTPVSKQPRSETRRSRIQVSLLSNLSPRTFCVAGFNPQVAGLPPPSIYPSTEQAWLPPQFGAFARLPFISELKLTAQFGCHRSAGLHSSPSCLRWQLVPQSAQLSVEIPALFCLKSGPDWRGSVRDLSWSHKVVPACSRTARCALPRRRAGSERGLTVRANLGQRAMALANFHWPIECLWLGVHTLGVFPLLLQNAGRIRRSEERISRKRHSWRFFGYRTINAGSNSATLPPRLSREWVCFAQGINGSAEQSALDDTNRRQFGLWRARWRQR